MAELAHTCIMCSPWSSSTARCPGCQARFEQVSAKERELLLCVSALCSVPWPPPDDPCWVAIYRLGIELRRLQGLSP